ncbi:MAG: hypothetical protein RIF33_11675 [Cyclobacteriaceae bacterium]
MTTRKFDFKNDNLEKSLNANEDQTKPDEDWFVYKEGHSPTIDFQPLDGKRIALRYAYLLSIELMTIDNEQQIKLLYSTHTVTVKGYCLTPIYELMRNDGLASLRANDNRYENLKEDNTPFIKEIDTVWRNTQDKA